MKLLLIFSALLFLNSCRDRDRDLQISVAFLNKGHGTFQICLDEEGSDEEFFKHLNYHLYATTKSGKTRDIEKSFYDDCLEQDFIQYKLGTYEDWELKEMEEEFVSGNIKTVKVEIFYDGEYDSPFLIKEFSNL